MIVFLSILLAFSTAVQAKVYPSGVQTDQSLNIQVHALDTPATNDLPPSWDWRNINGQNWMTPVRDQNGCGSCVAMGAASTLETQMKISSGFSWWQPQVSVQSMFACGGGNCGNGWVMEFAADLLKTAGVPDEACSPYVAKSGAEFCQNCTDHKSRRVYTYESKQISFGTVDPLVIKKALLHGPVWALMIVYDDFWNYKFGVYKNQTGKAGPGHTIAIIGYDDSKKAWIVKNSWGENWGNKGYGMIHYNDISGLGTIAFSLILPNDSSYVTIQDLQQGSVITGQKNLQLISLRNDISEYALSIENDKGVVIEQLSCQSQPCSILLDSKTYPDGNYTFKPKALTTSGKEIFGWTVSAKIQNTTRPAWNTFSLPAQLQLQGLARLNFNNSMLANELHIKIYKNQKLVQKRDIYDLPSNFQLRWDTRGLENGEYNVEFSYRTTSQKRLLNTFSQHSLVSIKN